MVVYSAHRGPLSSVGAMDEDLDLAIAMSLQEEEEERQRRVSGRQQGSANFTPQQRSCYEVLSVPGLTATEGSAKQCHACKGGFLFSLGQIRDVNGRLYHYSCFKCVVCSEVISAGQPFCVSEKNAAYHQSCYNSTVLCICCNATLPTSFYRHPFFEEERYCVTHKDAAICFACTRREPLVSSASRERFVELQDGRKICMVCMNTAVFDGEEMRAIYSQVLLFMESSLGLALPPAMHTVPVLAVDLAAINENKRASTYGAHTRGLTISTASQIRHYGQGGLYITPSGSYLMRPPSVLHLEERREVTAVLVLYGLPHDLTLCIVAHEAFHVYLKLANEMPFSFDLASEEGLCQVVAEKCLEHYSQSHLSADSEVVRLRKFFRFQILTDESPMYGESYRKAAQCVECLGLNEVLEYLRVEKTLPVV